MVMKDFEARLSSVTSRLVQYEDGDVLLVSELMSEIDLLRKAVSLDSIVQKLLAFVSVSLKRLLDTARYESVQAPLTEALDLLSRLAAEALKEKLSPEDITDPWAQTRLGQKLTDCLENCPDQIPEVRPPVSEGRSEEPVLAMASEAFRIFLTEAAERLIQAQDLVMTLEENPENAEAVNILFRVFHTIKGECGFLKITGLGELAHNLENLLSLVRDGTMKIEPNVTDIFMSGIDYAGEMVSALKAGNVAIYSKVDVSGFIQRINQQIRKGKSSLGDLLITEGKLTENDVEDILTRQKDLVYSKKFGEIAVDEHLISKEDLEATLSKQKVKEAGGQVQSTLDSIVKVKSSQINYLVDMVGELMIIEAQLDDKLQNLTQLKKITKEIQYASMQLRTEKVKNLFIEMKRAARDTARQLGKNVAVVINGDDLEIDRDLVETLQEPLLHLVRNAISHGIEEADERQAAGKSRDGTIKIEAERRGNSIVIAVRDDGRGLSRTKIGDKAVEKKLAARQDLDRMSDQEIYRFIFQPGFSTAENVNLVSGRGVGMDIVRTATEQARGHVNLVTREGEFSRVEMIFPLSTAIIDGMIVRSRGTSFIIPVANIIESMNVEPGMVRPISDDLDVIVVREEVIPVIRLKDYFRQTETFSIEARDLAVIVQNNENRKFALFLDEIITKREVFIKSLGSSFNELKGISSGTILQGGKIGFVLDIETICTDTGVRIGAGIPELQA